MLDKIRKADGFTKNILIVFLGTGVFNFLNLLYQLLIAHNLRAADFAAFNSLLSIFVIMSAPLLTLETAVTKYTARFTSRNEGEKVSFLLSDLTKKALILFVVTFVLFLAFSPFIARMLKIESFSSGYILGALVAFIWLAPIFSGGIQGLEYFRWYSWRAVISGVLKLTAAFVFLTLGFGVNGALGALLFSVIVNLAVGYIPLRNFLRLKIKRTYINYREILLFLFPVALSNFCYCILISSDMIFVKYYFSIEDAGVYSLAQMVGKIFLFLPGAISIVMFPKVSGMEAKNMDSGAVLRRSILYVSGLCIVALVCYNIFPGLILKILTGKPYPESMLLGRLFGVSMSFLALIYIQVLYFLSKKDLRFLKYLVFSTLLQILAILFFHQSLVGIQLILCFNSFILFSTQLFLSIRPKR